MKILVECIILWERFVGAVSRGRGKFSKRVSVPRTECWHGIAYPGD